VASGGRATVLNVARLPGPKADAAVAALVADGIGRDWRDAPPELSEVEWAAIYMLADFGTIDAVAANLDMSVRTATRRLASACAAFNVATDTELLAVFENYRLPRPA
jgi:hypothetical protein